MDESNPPLYSTGEEVKPGDKVRCIDGLEGRVTCTLTPGDEPVPGFDYDPATKYMVTKSDGAVVVFKSLNPTVTLLSHPKPLISERMISSPDLVFPILSGSSRLFKVIPSVACEVSRNASAIILIIFNSL